MTLSIDKVLAGWKVWGIPALVLLLAPWQNTITGLELIPAYYQPRLNGFASAVGALGAMIGYAFLNDAGRPTQRRWAIWSGVLFALSFLVCLVLKLTLGVVLFPEPGWQEAIDVLYQIAYVAIFGASGMLIICLLLAGTNRNPPPRPPTPRRRRPAAQPAAPKSR